MLYLIWLSILVDTRVIFTLIFISIIAVVDCERVDLGLVTFTSNHSWHVLRVLVEGFYSLYARCDSYLRPFLYFMIAAWFEAEA